MTIRHYLTDALLIAYSGGQLSEAGGPCICLAATDAPLRFNAFLPRMLQPLFRI